MVNDPARYFGLDNDVYTLLLMWESYALGLLGFQLEEKPDGSKFVRAHVVKE